MRREGREERRDVQVWRVSLSVQDLERVEGLSARAGLRRTTPRWEKWLRPRREVVGAVGVAVLGGGVVVVGVGRGHGVASAWASITSSMLASPQGAAELYITKEMLGERMKGCWYWG